MSYLAGLLAMVVVLIDLSVSYLLKVNEVSFGVKQMEYSKLFPSVSLSINV